MRQPLFLYKVSSEIKPDYNDLSTTEPTVVNLDVGGGLCIYTSARLVAEALAPAAVVIQIFLKIAIMIVGVENVYLTLLKFAVSVDVTLGIYKPVRSTAD